MPHQVSQLKFAGSALVIVVGLGLGFAAARLWNQSAFSPVPEPSGFEALHVSTPPTQTVQKPGFDPAPSQKNTGKRALLVGVTKYDNVPKARLDGPSNDVRLMRRFLEERYQFPANAIVSLTDDDGAAAHRPIRANIEREFRRLADEAREGDQIVILLAGHGSRQPESNPPNPESPEPDGIDEIFLPADANHWKGFPERVQNAIVDDEIGAWLRAITEKRAYVWAIFDCCHSGTMTRGTEVVRELPPEMLVPHEELEKARQRAAQRQGTTRGGSKSKPTPFVPRQPNDYLVATYACRSHESTPEGLEPPGSRDAEPHGLLTYSVVDTLVKSAESKSSLTYRELVRRLQARYAGRPQGSPTPLVEGRGQDRLVLGTEQPTRSPLVLTREKLQYRVNGGALHGLTPGSILAAESPAGADGKRKLLGHLRVKSTRPFDATVETCAYDGMPEEEFIPPLSTCRTVYIDYGLRPFKVAVQSPNVDAKSLHLLQESVRAIADAKGGLVELVDDPRQAHWIVRSDQGKVELIEASGNGAPFPLPAPDDPSLGESLRSSLEKVYRARNLVALSSKFEQEHGRGAAAVDIEVEVLKHKTEIAEGEVLPMPAGGWVFRPGDFISFRLTNKSQSLKLDVTLLIVGSDFEIHPFYPRDDEVGKVLNPGETITSPPPPGQISEDPPFGPESLVVIAAPASNPPIDFSALAQGGLPQVRAADKKQALQSPLGELLESAMFRSGTRSGLGRSIVDRHALRILNWRTEPK
jgi:hypothetical protein